MISFIVCDKFQKRKLNKISDKKILCFGYRFNKKSSNQNDEIKLNQLLARIFISKIAFEIKNSLREYFVIHVCT